MIELALITGGAQGIGFALAKLCCQKGMKVILLDNNTEALDAAKAELGSDAFIFNVDLADSETLLWVAKEIIQKIGVPNYLFNNAGIGGPSVPLWEQDLTTLKKVMDINFFSAFTLIKFFLPKMIEQKIKGAIVNTASMASFYTAPLISNYVISKHSIMALTECLYHDLKAHDSDIQVAVVCPGGVKTGILDSEANDQMQDFSDDQKHFLIKFAKLIKKGMAPEQVAEIIFAGLEHKQFYIFTHPEMLNIVEQRMASILKQSSPSPLEL